MHALIQTCNGVILALNFVTLGPAIGFLLPVEALLHHLRWPIASSGVYVGLVGGQSMKDFPSAWNKVALVMSGAAWTKILIDWHNWRYHDPLGERRNFLNHFAFGHLVGLSIQFLLAN